MAVQVNLLVGQQVASYFDKAVGSTPAYRNQCDVFVHSRFKGLNVESDAAREINALISSSSDQVQQGVSLVDETGSALAANRRICNELFHIFYQPRCYPI